MKEMKNKRVATNNRLATLGFIAIRRELLLQSILNNKNVNNEMAYIYLIALAAYRDQDPERSDEKRGDCLVSIKQMANTFGWSSGQRVYFMRWLKENGLATFKSKGHHSSITLLRYEEDTMSSLTYKSTRPSATPTARPADYNLTPMRTDQPDHPFEEIRNLYQRLTYRKVTDMMRTLRLWKRLTPECRTVALRNLPTYLNSIKDLRYAKQLYNYLADETYILSNEDYLFTHPLQRHEDKE